MKKLLAATVAAVLMGACSGTGDRTYSTETITDSANYPIGNSLDSTPTSNNNSYNPDSAAGRLTPADTAARRDTVPQP